MFSSGCDKMTCNFDSSIELFHPDYKTPTHSEVQFKPKSGVAYILQWATENTKVDWRSDGYRWKQNGKVKFLCNNFPCEKIYFKLQIGINPPSFTTKFKKAVFLNPQYPNCALLCYEGDESVAIDLPHGNAKKSNKIQRPFVRTKSSVMLTIKEKAANGIAKASEIHNLIEQSAPRDPIHQLLDAPRDVKQCSNAMERERLASSLSGDGLYNLTQLILETNGFIHDFHVAPTLLVTCFRKGT